MKKKNGFTLIELLAVIIILGVLMIIAIPSVTTYISNSRKSSYINTAKEIIAGTRTFVNEGKLEMYDTSAMYYIPTTCINTENGARSPYGDFEDKGAYVGVTFDGKGYSYYWISNDTSGQGIDEVTPLNELDEEKIVSNIKAGVIEEKVKETAMDGRTRIVVYNGDCTGKIGEYVMSGTTPSNIVCKPATTLHTKTCNRTDSNGCNATGQAGNGKTITYGTIPNPDDLEEYTPKAGDAYDCKVTQDGDYTERFYYVGSEGNNSILIYYTNMNDQTMYAYDSSNQNYHGPRTAYQYLPDTSTWNNPGLIAPGTRQIVAQNGATSTSGGTIESFTYTDKAARFLTYQEVASACGSSGMTTAGYLNNCTWLMENLGQYEGLSGAYGYWLETPRSSYTSYVWSVGGYTRNVSYNSANGTSVYGVRPVITVLTSNISN